VAVALAVAVDVALAQRKRDSAARRHRLVVGRRDGSAFGFAFGVAATRRAFTTQELLEPLTLARERPVRAHLAMVVIAVALHATVIGT